MRWTNPVVLMSALCGLAECVAASEQKALPPVLEYYPVCDYTVLDTLKTSDRVKTDEFQVTREARQLMLDKIVTDIQSEAQSQGADAIILLTRKEAESNRFPMRQHMHVMKVKAQLIADCDLSEGLTDKKTPKSAQLRSTYSIDVAGKSALAIHVEVGGQAVEKQSGQPILPQALTKQGSIYGVMLGTSMQDVMAVWGEPALRVRLSDQHQLLAFGRDFYAVFAHDVLLEASNRNHYLSTDLRNLLPVDERFEHHQLRILERITLGNSLQDIASQLPGLKPSAADTFVLRSPTAELELTVDTRSYINRQNSQPLRYFTLRQPGADSINPRNYQAESSVYQSIEKMMTVGTADPDNALTALTSQAIGTGKKNRTTSLVVVDNHLVLETRSNTVRKIHVLETAVKADLSTPPAWQIGAFHFGASRGDLSGQVSEDAFVYADEIQLSNDVSDHPTAHSSSTGCQTGRSTCQIALSRTFPAAA